MATNVTVEQDSMERTAKTISTSAEESFVKMEEHVKIWSTLTNAFVNQDSMERIAKTISTNV